MREEKRLYAEFLALPNVMRHQVFGYTTQKSFSEEYGISEKTLWLWKSDKEVLKHMKKMTRTFASDGVAEVINTMKNQGIEGSESSAKIYLEFLGEMIKRSEIGFTQEKMDEIIDGFIAIIKNRVKDQDIINLIAKDIDKLLDDDADE